MRIEKVELSKEIQERVMDGFAQQAFEATGYDGGIHVFSFAAYEGDEIVGVADCKFFWGAVHIRWLFIFPPYRHKGYGSALMEKALSHAKKCGSKFAFVETMQFQAADFYKKLGFEIEFSRPGYAKDGIFHYLKKDL